MHCECILFEQEQYDGCVWAQSITVFTYEKSFLLFFILFSDQGEEQL